MKDLFALFGVVAVVLVAVALIRHSEPLDSTDDHATGARSDMRVLVDHGTGLQYLKASGGGLTPRLDAAGNHMRAGSNAP